MKLLLEKSTEKKAGKCDGCFLEDLEDCTKNIVFDTIFGSGMHDSCEGKIITAKEVVD